MKLNTYIENIKNIPNLITLLRLLLIPIFCYLSYSALSSVTLYKVIFAIILFIVIRLTDVIDGWVARKTNTVTIFGSYFDVGTDFIFVLSSYFVLYYMQVLPLWMILIVIYKFTEFLIISNILKTYCIKNSINNTKVLTYDILGRIASALFYLIPSIVLIFKYLNTGYVVLDIMYLCVLIFTIWASIIKIIKMYVVINKIEKNSVNI